MRPTAHLFSMLQCVVVPYISPANHAPGVQISNALGVLYSLRLILYKCKNLLVRDHWTDFHIILQKCSLCDPLPRLFKPFGFVKKWLPGGQGLFSLYIYIENFKNLLVRNHWTNFNIILHKCSSHLDSSKNMAAKGWGLFSLYIYIENLKNLLVRNHWTDFHIILQKCSFGDPLPRLFEPFGFVKNMAAGVRGLFSLYIYRKM